MGKLTNKQARFVDEYMIDLNATQAAIRAGYSKKTAKEIGFENLTKPYIAEEIAKRQEGISDRNKITVDELIQILAEDARVDPLDVFDENGNVQCLEDIPPAARRAIKKIVSSVFEDKQGNKTTRYQVELYSKHDAIEKLMKHLGGYEQDNKQRVATVEIIQLPDNNRD